jgi:formylglycine-generating enzyme required for sulfatase activity
LAETTAQRARDQQARAKRMERIQQELQTDKTRRHWYVNGQGQALVVIPGPAEFTMGTPPDEAGRIRGFEEAHRRKIGRSFAIGATPVTRLQIQPLLKLLHPNPSKEVQDLFPEDSRPVWWADWYDAARYCNWLSQQEGISPDQWCYETDASGQVVKLKPNYLSLTGYRLPTEAEWEYACRAGAVTSRHYGETEELLDKYGWYSQNSRFWTTGPVRSKKPNDWGLFDMHGNVLNWCQEKWGKYPEGESQVFPDLEDKKLDERPHNDPVQDSRVVRGGAWDYAHWYIRSGARTTHISAYRYANTGFRVARTFPTEGKP